MKFINVGFNNMIAASRIVALINPDSAPAKRMIQDSKDMGRAIDCTSGRRTRSVIITDSEHIVLSAIQPETIANRLSEDARPDSGYDPVQEAGSGPPENGGKNKSISSGKD